MEWCHFGQPHVPVDARALVEPTITIGGIHANHEYVTRAIAYEVGDIDAKRGVAVVISTDEATVDKHQRVTKHAVELDNDPPAKVGRGNVETAAIPANGVFRILAPERLVTVAL